MDSYESLKMVTLFSRKHRTFMESDQVIKQALMNFKN
jgi:hypothetical protein